MNKPVAGVIAFVSLVLCEAAVANAFGLSFDWGGIPRCTSGHPGTVNNPRFRLTGVPSGTAKITFRLRDNNVPSYNHGGGTVPYSGGSSIPSGAFNYKSPCPPHGSHTYTWTATAYDASGKKVGSATASKKYP
jgi:phosphatidylethanolamine-binding protein (PEBP) family uncharacterized protein